MKRGMKIKGIFVGIAMLALTTLGGCEKPQIVDPSIQWKTYTIYQPGWDPADAIEKTMGEADVTSVNTILDAATLTDYANYVTTDKQMMLLLIKDDKGSTYTFVTDLGKYIVFKNQNPYQIDQTSMQKLLNYFSINISANMPPESIRNKTFEHIRSNLSGYDGLFLLDAQRNLDYHEAMNMVSWRYVKIGIDTEREPNFTFSTRDMDNFYFYEAGNRWLVLVSTFSFQDDDDVLYSLPQEVYETLVSMIKTDLAFVGAPEYVLNADFVTAYVLGGTEESTQATDPLIYPMTLNSAQKSEINRLLKRETWKKLNAVEYAFNYQQLLVDQQGVRYYLIAFDPFTTNAYVRVETETEVTMYLVGGNAVQDTLAYVKSTYVPKAPDPVFSQVHITKGNLATPEQDMGLPVEDKAFAVTKAQADHLLEIMALSTWREIVDTELGRGWRYECALTTSENILFAFSHFSTEKDMVYVLDERDPKQPKMKFYFVDTAVLDQLIVALEDIRP